VQAWFLAHFPKFYTVNPNPDYIENLPVAARWTLQKGHGEGTTYRMALDRITFEYAEGRTNGTGRSRLSRRYSGIQAGLCAVIVGCTVTCLRGY
jgi:hypothetical protein